MEDVKVGEHMAFFGVRSSGWSNNGLSLAWRQQVFERFTTGKARRKYRLLLVDGHGSHLAGKILEHCHRHKILLAVYPPHSTHTLQPLDVVMFKLLSTAYLKKLQQSTVKHQGLVSVKKSDFFSLSWDAWVTSFIEKNILNSFKTTAVSPLNLNVIVDRFTNNSSDTSSEASSEASCYSGEDWRSLDRVSKRALSSASKKDVAIVRQSLHHMAIQN
ncbi:pogo transposable [Pyrenophora seminiperda CCB06]|uniref:Pogo transposable n=1 Tax=Pyrenophora seminiperda CCB06 TaxID=1302712 RepID=A0A3M7MA87_9PLEO|nr:pogo transposable [Pyrenophora seminiperda CCB06]